MRAIIVALLLCGIAHADEPRKPAPTQMSDADTLRLYKTLRELDDLAPAIKKYVALIAKRDEVCKRYDLDCAQIGKTVSFDFDTGKIARAPAPPKK